VGPFGLPLQGENLSWGVEPGAPLRFAPVDYGRDLRSGSARKRERNRLRELCLFFDFGIAEAHPAETAGLRRLPLIANFLAWRIWSATLGL